jgi:Ala-tRNA(Pro) deacylase
MKLEAKSLLAALDLQKIEYKLFEHEAFFTVEESSKLKIDLNMQGAHTKNLFLRDKKRNFYLLSCLDSTDVDLKMIKNVIQCQGNLSFGSADYLYEKLGVKPGSVSPYSLINNEDKDVSFYLDKGINEFDLCNFHPLDNTKTIQVKTTDCIKFLKTITTVKLLDFTTMEIISL